VENGSLASPLKTFGKLPEHMLVVFMRQILVGLEWLHAQGICHRDIKGANLLTTKDGQVKLADFGVAGTLKSSHEDRQADGRGSGAGQQAPVGTPYWMAPEIIEMSGFTTASAIWSLGCTVLELFTGEPPYFDLRWVNALYRIVQDTEPPIPAGMPALLDDFLRCCFVRDPAVRATAAQLRHHAWLSWSLHSTASPVPTGMPPTRSGSQSEMAGERAVKRHAGLKRGPKCKADALAASNSMASWSRAMFRHGQASAARVGCSDAAR